MALKSSKEAGDPLLWIQKLVRMEYVEFSDHVYMAISIGDYDDRDILDSIQNAVSIKKQKDEMRNSKDGWKYIITGLDRSGLSFDTVGKIVDGDNDDDCFFVITAYGRR